MKENNFLQVKGYGDLVALVAVLNHLGFDDKARIFISPHLADLAIAITIRNLSRAEFIELSYLGSGLPALFDIKKRGLTNAVRSLLDLSKSLREQPWQSFIVDNFSIRERILSSLSRKTILGLPVERSIYKAYEALIIGATSDKDVPTASMCNETDVFNSGRVSIFPRSRVSNKDLSDDTVRVLVKALEAAGIAYQISLLPYEVISHEFSDSVKYLDADFGIVIDEILQSSHIITADTLACHLATLLRIKVFPILNIKNDYFLPPGIIRHERWSLAGDVDLVRRLSDFVSE